MTRYVVRITPADVGQRVSVRHRTHDDPPYTDVVGQLLSWQAGVLVIQRRDGTRSTVAADDVVAGKLLPPSPPPSR